MTINSLSTNVAAQFARSQVSESSTSSALSVGRLSSGARITQASDDVAALGAGTSLRTSVQTTRANIINTAQSASLLQVADGALQEMTNILQRQKSLATQASSGALTSVERGFLDQEFQQLSQEIDRIASSTRFNGNEIFQGNGVSLETRTTVNNAFSVFNIQNNAGRYGVGAGRIRVVDADGNNIPNGIGRALVDDRIYGKIENLQMSDIVFNTSARISLEINGIKFEGTITANANRVRVTDGNTFLEVGTAAFRLQNQARANQSLARMRDDLEDTRIFRRKRVMDADFTGTRLEGPNTRIFLWANHVGDQATIENFRYIGDRGVNNSAQLAVDINGKTFITNSNINDNLRNNRLIRFFGDGTRERFDIRLGQIDQIGNAGRPNIRTDETIRKEVIDALNIGFARGGSADNVGINPGTDQDIRFRIDPVNTEILYGPQTLTLGSADSAVRAGEQIESAINYVISVRADVGAAQSRINFATSSLEISLQNQDAARAVFLDTNVATESTGYSNSLTKSQIAVSILAQANALNASFLDLLG